MRWLFLFALLLAVRGSMLGDAAVLPTSSPGLAPTSSPAALKVGHPEAGHPEAGSATVHEIASLVDRHYNSLRSLRVAFTESYEGMGLHRTESGTMLLKKSGIEKLSKMRWSYTSPAGKLFVLDGKYAWFYAPGDAQVQQLPASQLDDLRSPLRFLLGHTRLEKELSGLTMASKDGGYLLHGVPNGMEKRVAAISVLVTAEGVIRSMTIKETAGAVTSFTFSQEEPNAPVTNQDFEFAVPAGVPVVKGLPPV